MSLKVNHPPGEPLLLYDGECAFCERWITAWRAVTQGVQYRTYQDEGARFPEILVREYAARIQLVMPDGTVFSGAQAVFEALSRKPDSRGWQKELYQKVPLFARVSEFVYGSVSHHRVFFSFWTKVLWNNALEPQKMARTRNLFLKVMGFIYLCAFYSVAKQIIGLVGSDGVLPAKNYLQMIYAQLGVKSYWLNPTIFWLNASQTALYVIAYIGVAFSLLTALGLTQAPLFVILWVLYLSIINVGGVFLSFQWDILLLEAGFLCVFLAPWRFGKQARTAEPSRVIIFLFRLLLFKLMFCSGVVKFSSHDETWRNLTALTFHYETQPLPHWIAWFAHQLPVWFQKLSCAIMFAIELIVPFFIFTPRGIRRFVFVALVGLQLLIIMTGNYCFFNWLTIGLCLLLLDDGLISRGDPKDRREVDGITPHLRRIKAPFGHMVIACLVLILSIPPMARALRYEYRLPTPLRTIQTWLYPFHLVSGYGLFAVMTTTRPEISVEGSEDGKIWKPYEFRYKPGPLDRKPGFVAPHQPRLDWQMWFAALSSYRDNPWFVNFCVRLLEGAPAVLALLKDNPFPEHPPRYVRAMLYRYEFTNSDERRATGNWWKREFAGQYLPVISLQSIRKA